jgi:hypothetical protein
MDCGGGYIHTNLNSNLYTKIKKKERDNTQSKWPGGSVHTKIKCKTNELAITINE